MKVIRNARRQLAQLRHTHQQFGDLVHKERKLFYLAFLMLAGEILFMVLGPIPMVYIIDGLVKPSGDLFLVPPGYLTAGTPEVIAEHQRIFLAVVCSLLVAFAFLGGWCGYLRRVWSATAGQRIVFKLRKRMYAHMQQLSLRFHRDSRLGDLLLRITGDIAMLRDVLSTTIVELVGQVLTVITVLIILLVVDPLTGAISMGAIVCVVALSGVSGRRIRKVTKSQREKEGVIAHTAGEGLASVSLVKAFGAEDKMVRDFGRKNRASMRSSLKGTRLQALLARRVELVFAVAVAAVMAFAVLRLFDDAIRVGVLILLVSYVRRLNKPLRKIANMANKIGKGAACGDRVMEIFNLEPEEVDLPDAQDAPAFEGAIDFEGLNFSYHEEQPVLSDVNFKLAPGETVGLVGRNGAGKSTLLHLLLRFYEPTTGRITIDGHDIRDYKIRSLRSRISIALQDTLLFGTTIRENLQCAKTDASDDEISHALGQVGAGFVLDLPDGLDSELAEKGENLSGGERRKLALASAVLRDSSILILDEPTTGIDRASRDDIIERLPGIASGRTCIVISHDPDMLRHLDRVVYLESGQVAGVGTHQELSNDSQGYRTLFSDGPLWKEASTP